MNYVNLEWVDRTPIVGNSIFHTSSIVVGGHLHVTGNTINSNGDTDVMTIKYDTNGDTLWMSTFNGSANGDDYGVELQVDASGNVYVASAVKNVSTGYDFCVLKYNSSGTLLWDYSWNGAGNGDDIPTMINIDALGTISSYVVGLSEASNGLSDYGMIKVSSTGTLTWSQYYDYNDLHDGATGFSGGGPFTINVTGVSAATAGDWDIATVALNKSSGSISNTNRTNVTGATMEEAFAMTTDSMNNVYITGYALVSGEKQVQTVKLDSNLALVWIQNYAEGDNAVGKDISVDNTGNIYVTGFIEIDSGRTNMLTLKYNSSGTLQWERQNGNAGDHEMAEAKRMVLDTEGNVYVTGTITDAEGSKMKFIKYTTNGDVRIAKEYTSENVDYEAYNIQFEDNNVYISGLEKTIDTTRFTVLKYNISERDIVSVTDTNDVELYVADELIVSFHPDSIKIEAINNKDRTFGNLSDFVNQGVIDFMDEEYPSIDWERVKAYKMFQGLTTNDTISISRTGFEVEMPKYWATLLIEIPEANEISVRDTFNQNGFPVIQHIQVNELYTLATDDPFYASQHGLYNTSNYPEADINMIQAWYTENGKSNIKVGIYDTGIRYSHEDLGGGISPTGKVRGGKDYFNGTNLSDVPNNGDPHGHGTKVAGVIGAIKDNEAGVAGIAGGYWPHPPGEEIQSDPDPEEGRGVSLYGFKITSDGGTLLTADLIAPALIEGSSNTTAGYGYGLHIMNCSFVSNIGAFDDSTLALMNNAQRTAFRNGTILVAGKGNSGTISYQYPAYSPKEFWVISVGACDTTGNKRGDSNYGAGLDIIAPGDDSLVYTTYNGSNSSYSTFKQTSAATAHATGVAALMLSHINDQFDTPNNLTPDDVEFLIQRYADDRDETSLDYTVGYDNYTGWGLLNAGSTLHHTNKTYFLIKHYYTERVFHPDSSYVTSSSGSAVYYCGNESHAFGVYAGSMHYISYITYHTLNPGDSIYNSWPLNSYTNVMIDEPGSLQPEKENEMQVSFVTNNSAYVVGHVFHATQDPYGNPVDFWYPINPGETAKFGYTLHIQSDYATVEEEESISTLQISCYPNPTTGTFTVSLKLPENSAVSAEITDINGRLIQSWPQQNLTNGQHNLNLDVSYLSKGMYLLRLNVNGDFYYEKFIKE